MASDCIICGSPLSFTGCKQIVNGKICKACANKLPPLVLEKSGHFDDQTLRELMDAESHFYEQFSVTASLGSLHIDELHGLFAISKKLHGEKPEELNIFSIYDLEEAGLYCKSPIADHENVFVDIEFSCTLLNPDISFKEVIKKRDKCSSKRVNPREIEWQFPHDMEMFRTMFNYMLSGAFAKLNKMMCGKSIREFELDKAKALFMIRDRYTAEYLDETRASLLHVFDTGERGCEYAVKSINDAYNMLRVNLRNNL